MVVLYVFLYVSPVLAGVVLQMVGIAADEKTHRH